MKTTLTLRALSCFLLALALTNAQLSKRQLRREEDYTTPEPESPLDAFRLAIQKFQDHDDTRQLRADDDGQQVIENFIKAIEKFSGKDEHFRRTEEDDTEHHVDYLLGLISGHNVIKSKTDE